MQNIGCRIFTKVNRPPKELIEGFRGLATANIADNMNRFFCVDAEIKSMNGVNILGSALTVRTRSSDNLFVHKAIDMAQPGDVIVVESQGYKDNAVIGEIMMKYAIKKGVAGFLIDGVIRDLTCLRDLNFAVYARGVNPKGPYKDGPGEINVPICCGGVIVNPGDIIIGDDDGVVIVKPENAEEILEQTIKTHEKEVEILQSIEDGTIDRNWVNMLLEERSCQIIKDSV